MLCKYPKWVINKVLHKQEDHKKSAKKRQIPTSEQAEKKWHIVVPYVQGICEKL